MVDRVFETRVCEGLEEDFVGFTWEAGSRGCICRPGRYVQSDQVREVSQRVLFIRLSAFKSRKLSIRSNLPQMLEMSLKSVESS